MNKWSEADGWLRKPTRDPRGWHSLQLKCFVGIKNTQQHVGRVTSEPTRDKCKVWIPGFGGRSRPRVLAASWESPVQLETSASLSGRSGFWGAGPRFLEDWKRNLPVVTDRTQADQGVCGRVGAPGDPRELGLHGEGKNIKSQILNRFQQKSRRGARSQMFVLRTTDWVRCRLLMRTRRTLPAASLNNRKPTSLFFRSFQEWQLTSRGRPGSLVLSVDELSRHPSPHLYF